MSDTAVANEPFTAADGTAVETLTDSTARWSGVDFTSAYTTVTSNKCNLAFSTGGALMVFRETGTYTNDQYAAIIVDGVFTGGVLAGVTVRTSGSAGTATYYEWQIDTNSASPYTTVLRKVVNRTPTTLDTRTIAWVAGDEIRLRVVGTTLYCLRNGAVVFTLTDATISTGTPGYSIHDTAAGAHSLTLDNWEGGNSTVSAGANQGLPIDLGRF